jgi:hypothetical protein
MTNGIPQPIGHEHVMKSGFVKVKVAEPNVWKLKHRIVAEQMLGRELLPNERIRLRNSKKTRANPQPEDITIYTLTEPGKYRKHHVEQPVPEPTELTILQSEVTDLLERVRLLEHRDQSA